MGNYPHGQLRTRAIAHMSNCTLAGNFAHGQLRTRSLFHLRGLGLEHLPVLLIRRALLIRPLLGEGKSVLYKWSDHNYVVNFKCLTLQVKSAVCISVNILGYIIWKMKRMQVSQEKIGKALES